MKDSSWSHFRRCHKCGHVHILAGERVEACPSCGKIFAPFFFAEHLPELSTKLAELMANHDLRTGKAKPLTKPATHYQPLIGFSEWWSERVGTSPTRRIPNA